MKLVLSLLVLIIVQQFLNLAAKQNDCGALKKRVMQPGDSDFVDLI